MNAMRGLSFSKNSILITSASLPVVGSVTGRSTLTHRLKPRAGVPKLSLSMYPFSILIDEHVPLNMSAGRIFSRKGQ